MTTAIASGLGATIGFAQEGTVGTFQTPTRFLTFNKESLKWKKNVVQSKALHGGLYLLGNRRALVTHTAAGSIDLDLYDRGLGMLFQNMVGGTPVIAAGPSSTYMQVYTPADLTGAALSVQVGRPTTAGVQTPFSYNGGKVTDWTIAVANNSVASLSLSVDAWNESLVPTYTAPSYVPSNMLHFAEAALFAGGTVVPVVSTAAGGSSQTLPLATITVVSTTGFPTSGIIFATAGATVQQIAYTGVSGTTFTGCTGGTGTIAAAASVTSGFVTVTSATKVASATGCTIKTGNPLATSRFFLGSLGTKAEQLANDFRAISGQADFEFANTTDVLTAFYADTPLALQLTFTGPIIGGAVTSGVSILIPQIRWDGDPPSVDGPAVLKYTAPFTGLDDSVDSQVQIQYTTLDAAA